MLRLPSGRLPVLSYLYPSLPYPCGTALPRIVRGFGPGALVAAALVSDPLGLRTWQTRSPLQVIQLTLVSLRARPPSPVTVRSGVSREIGEGYAGRSVVQCTEGRHRRRYPMTPSDLNVVKSDCGARKLSSCLRSLAARRRGRSCLHISNPSASPPCW